MMQPNEETSNIHCVSVRYEFCTISCFLLPYFVVKGGKLRHFDEVAETLLLHHVVCHVELEVGRLLGEDSRPCVETADVLPFQFLRAQVLKEQVQFRQTVGNSRAGQERSP